MKKIDQQFVIYIRGILLIGFSLLMFKLILTGKIIQFIAPKMMPFILFSSGTFFLLGIIQIWRSSINKDLSCECGHDHTEKGKIRTTFFYSLFLLPIMTGFLFSNHTLDSSVAVRRGLSFSVNTPDTPQQAGNDEKIDTTNSELEKDTNDFLFGNSEETPKNVPTRHQNSIAAKVAPKGFHELLEKKLLKKPKISINDTDYIPVMNIIENNTDQFVGKKIEVSGFVYHEKGFKDNQFVVARFGISCCAADASVYGLLSTLENASALKKDTWVHIKGIIQKTTYNGENVPYIQVQRIESIHKPDNPYVYELYQGEQLIGPGE
ncbi:MULTISPECIES: TIGR03943 family putative permease subunit [Priestia]|uniref:TIGR03943 family protein n=1 Tax=Priestia aryabhattai TaxID=412384 RepID=A0ABD5KQ56_PRIAR|nr:MULTISPECIES: TIGR03943 family protein [Priestia]MBK0296035.1 TIGR03943 family protein [Bacillus sp. S34]AWD66654.1 TIGR03943 family protein [Priestia megaterium]MBY0214715.1 TIGR03943 family protein [Priestia aryabhattai]MDC7763666.1 TIGR03943 family protein [Priestia aryabhattai]MEB4884505.1 TIGR03943 family protein [Priestia megaterium]